MAILQRRCVRWFPSRGGRIVRASRGRSFPTKGRSGTAPALTTHRRRRAGALQGTGIGPGVARGARGVLARAANFTLAVPQLLLGLKPVPEVTAVGTALPFPKLVG